VFDCQYVNCECLQNSTVAPFCQDTLGTPYSQTMGDAWLNLNIVAYFFL